MVARRTMIVPVPVTVAVAVFVPGRMVASGAVVMAGRQQDGGGGKDAEAPAQSAVHVFLLYVRRFAVEKQMDERLAGSR
ncbi:hypothetical protein ADT71_10255 [Novosphingobium sp. ST904]|nr:hypothetical protein ADT71_10255 [Novosphingobium sp. ST904]